LKVKNIKKIFLLLLIYTVAFNGLFFLVEKKISAAGYYATDSEFENYLATIGVKIKTNGPKFYKANRSTYNQFNLIVYGSPFGDYKKRTDPSQGNCIQGQYYYRYLGYDVNENPVTNSCYPNDDFAGGSLTDRNWIVIDSSMSSWGQMKQAQENQLLYGKLTGNGVTENDNFTVNGVGGKKYAQVLAKPTLCSQGSVKMNHRTSSGAIWYATFQVPAFGCEGSVSTKVVTDQSTYTIPADKNSIVIPVKVTSDVIFKGFFNSKDYVDKLYARLDNNGTSSVDSQTKTTTHSTSITVNRSDFTSGQTSKTITLNGKSTLVAFGDTISSTGSTTITVKLAPQTGEPSLECACNPTSVKYEDKDVDVVVNANAKITGVNSSMISKWVFYAHTKNGEQDQTLTVTPVGDKTKASQVIKFKIPKTKVTGDSYTEDFEIRAKVIFTDGSSKFTDLSYCSTEVYKNTPAPPTNDPGNPGPGPNPEPSENHPPFARIAWTSPVDNSPMPVASIGDFVNLRTLEMSDPDGDEVSLVAWDFSRSTQWLADLPVTRPITGLAPGYDGIHLTAEGTHTVYLTVQDSHGEQYTASASIIVVSPNPVAVITGSTRVKEGRTLPVPLSGDDSYSPIGRKLVDFVWTNKADMYPNVGEEEVTLKVKDEDGRWSQVATHNITVIPDEPPVAEITVTPEETRLGVVRVQSNSYSPDDDNIVSHKFELKYDAGNNGFDDDAWQTVQTGAADSYSFAPNRVGKYLFRETVCEDYGKCSTTDSQPESERTTTIVNLAPAADVKTSGDLSDVPEKNPISMQNLYSSGTLIDLDTGASGDKGFWKMDNGYLVTKNLRNDFGTFAEYSGWTNNKYLGDYGLNHSIFASIQNTPSFSPIHLGSGLVLYAFADEKYKYVVSKNDSSHTDILQVYDLKTEAFKYQISVPAGFYNGLRPYSVNGNLIYVPTILGDGFGFLVINKDTGAVVHSVNNGSSTIYSSIDNSGFVAGTTSDATLRKYRPDGSYVNTYSAGSFIGKEIQYLSPNGISMISGCIYANGYCNPSTYPRLFKQDFTESGSLQNGALLTKYTLVGLDEFQNFVGLSFYNYSDIYMTVHDQNGKLISMNPVPYLNSNARDQFGNLSLLDGVVDKNGRAWVISMTPDSTGKKSIEVIGINSNGSIFQRYRPFGEGDKGEYYGGLRLRLFQGSDGLLTFVGVYKGPSSLILKLLVINPDNGSFIRNDDINTGFPNSIPTFPQLAIWDDQAISVSFPETGTYLLKATGPLTFSKRFETGAPRKNLILGDNVSGDLTVEGEIVLTSPTNDGVGYLYRAQDTNNYYSVEFESGMLRIKKTVGGVTSTVFEKPYSVVANQTYSVKLVPNGNSFDLYINLIKQATITETSWKSGKFGVISRGHQGAKFGNVTTYKSGKTVGKINGVVLVGETLTYDVVYDDPEKDPRLGVGEYWTYTHNPNVFLQPQGTWSGSGQSFDSPVTSFTLPGEYTFKFRTKDDPHPEHRYPDGTFDEYRQPSNEVTGTIRVHRRPIADFDVTADATGKLTYVDRSYDPDRYNPATGQYSTENTGIDYATTRGAITYRWRWRMAGGEVHNEKLTKATQSGTYIIDLAVADEYGAWSEWTSRTITLTATPIQPPEPGFTVNPRQTYRGVPVTIDSAARDPQDGGRENIAHQWFIRNTSGGAETLQSTSRTTWTKTFNSLGVFRIRQVVTNSYGLSAEATDLVTIVNRKPAANVTTPASASPGNPTEFDTLRPQFVWTYSDADGDAQTQYQVQVIKSNSGGLVLLDSGVKIGGAAIWTASADLPEEVVLYVQVRVYDGYDWSDWSSPKYFIIDTNKPPISSFVCSPNPGYEGDAVTCTNTSIDPDGDPMTFLWTVSGPKGYSATFTSKNISLPREVTENRDGTYTIVLRATDSKGAVNDKDATGTVVLKPLSLDAEVNHTAQWLINLVKWNNENPKKQRPLNTFWAGESFDLVGIPTQTSSEGGSTTTASSISVVAAGIGSTNLMKLNATNWIGNLGPDNATANLEELADGPYNFVFTVTYSNGVKKSKTVTINILGDWTDYFRFHRKF
jgi:hypothetical protein